MPAVPEATAVPELGPLLRVRTNAIAGAPLIADVAVTRTRISATVIATVVSVAEMAPV